MISLCRDGRPCAQIVVAEHAHPTEQLAAEELQKFLRQMSGAELPIAHAPADEGPNVFIGAAAPTDGLDLSKGALNDDGFVVRTAGGNLILSGVEARSSLYAVYHLLERHLGCGFFEEGDQVPRRPTVEVGDLDDRSRPHFPWRIYEGPMPSYSGGQWWQWEEFKPWIEWMAKKRYNILCSNRLLYCGITALAAQKMGVDVPFTAWEAKRLPLMRRVFDHARLFGMRLVYIIDLHMGSTNGVPGASASAEGPQLERFVRRYAEQTGQELAATTIEWCDHTRIVLDPRDPKVREFITACVLAHTEALGTDHLYQMYVPTEEQPQADTPEEANATVYASVGHTIDAIKAGDPQAEIWSPRVCPDNPTVEAQAQAVRAAQLPVHGNYFLNITGRKYDFLRTDYYWGLPFTTGMCGQCGRETNPNGDIRGFIRNARELVNEPRAANCLGFHVSSETIHRNVMTMDLYAQIAWDPNAVDPDAYAKQWNASRYGDAAEKLWPATKAFVETIMSGQDLCTHNGPLYRNWDGTGLPGLAAASIKRLIGFLPKLHFVLETMLSEHEALKDSPMYRFDLIDIGRTYLAGIFNDTFARARKALRASDKEAFERHAAEVEDVMHFMAKYCGAHPDFRLKTYDDNAARWPEMVPGHANSETNWITFTALLSIEHWRVLLDYMCDDYAELVEHYYWPRVRLYLEKMREFVDAGKDISGRLVDRGTDVDLPSRIADWATPQGHAPWSAYGDTCEPELTAGDEDLAHELILAGTVSGRLDFHEGPLRPLVRELLDRFPPPDDLDEVMAERDAAETASRTFIGGKPGDTSRGFRAPGVVESVVVPPELKDLVEVEEIRREYNIARGEIALYQVAVSTHLIMTRQPDHAAPDDGRVIVVFGFHVMGRNYELPPYDGGSQVDVANIVIELV